MQQAINSTDIERKIKSKIGQPMSKQQMQLANGYLNFKYESAMLRGDEINANVYLEFMNVVLNNYNKFKNQNNDNEATAQQD